MTFQDAINLYAPDGVLCRGHADILSQILAVPFDPELHYPIVYMHLHYAGLKEAKSLLDHAVDKEDETYKQLEDYLNALEECDRSTIGIFPMTVPYRDWWNGPHLKFPENVNGHTLTAWFPLRVNYVEGETVHTNIAKLENGKMVYGDVPLPLDKFKEFLPFHPDSDHPELFQDMGEIAFYDEEYLINIHKHDIWHQPPELNAVREKVWPAIEKSHNLLNDRLKDEMRRAHENHNSSGN